MNFMYRSLRIISIAVLAFFLWTFGGVFDIAYAIKSDQQSAVSNQQINTGYPVVSSQPKTQKPEEKFQKAIDDIEQALSDTSTDTDAKKNRVKGKKKKQSVTCPKGKDRDKTCKVGAFTIEDFEAFHQGDIVKVLFEM